MLQQIGNSPYSPGGRSIACNALMSVRKVELAQLSRQVQLHAGGQLVS